MIAEWLDRHQDVLWALLGLSVLTFVGTLIVIPILVARMPADYFLEERPPPGSWRARHAILRWSLRLLKNSLGGVFVAAGIGMLFLPGQGVITILIGITLLDFPGKRRLERRVIRVPAIRRAVDWIRSKADEPPIEIPDSEGRPAEHRDDLEASRR